MSLSNVIVRENIADMKYSIASRGVKFRIFNFKCMNDKCSEVELSAVG